MHEQAVGRICLIGFGEAGATFAAGWRSAGLSVDVAAFDIKTDAKDPAVRSAMGARFAAHGVAGAATMAEALAGARLVFSLVTADQALAAATAAAPHIPAGALYLDGNSCAPGTKREAAARIDGAGGRYVDCAVMAPVAPQKHRTPLLLSGSAAADASARLAALDMAATLAPGDGKVGTASAIKMVRSVMVKGLEALVLECVLAGRRAGVDATVLASLEQTFPGFGWTARAAYMQERVMTHGIRRAAEMREVARTVAELGLDNGMASATARWQDQVGSLGLDAKAIGLEDYGRLADAILARLPAASPATDPATSQDPSP